MIRSTYRHWIVFITIAAWLAGAPSARAEVVKSIATGFDDTSKLVLSNGAAETDFTMGAGTPGGFAGSNPFTRVSPIPNGWVPDSASTASRRIVLPGSGLEGVTTAPGTYVFDLTVNLSGYDAATAKITGLRYAADNKLINVAINGTAVFSQNSNFAEEFKTFTTIGDVGLGLFNSGTNTIRFSVLNDLSGDSPLGLRIEGLLTANAFAVVPEPTSFVLVFGAAGLFFGRLCLFRK